MTEQSRVPMHRKRQCRLSGPYRPRHPSVPGLEPIEGRLLLSSASLLFSKFKAVRFGGAAYIVSVSGPGAVTTHKPREGGVDINLFGTTQDSQVSISALSSRSHTTVKPLSVESIQVHTSRVGSILGFTSADIEGPISALEGPVNSLQFDSIGPAAQIDVDGNLGQLTVNREIDFGPSGHLSVTGDVTGTVSVLSNVSLLGGKIQIGRDLAGSVSIGGTVTVNDGGMFTVGRNLGGSSAAATSPSSASGTVTGATGSTSPTSSGGNLNIAGDLILDSSGIFMVSGNVDSAIVGGNVEVSSGGMFEVTGNLSSLTINGSGSTGSLILNMGGAVSVSGNLGNLAVGDNLVVAQNAEIHVGGNLTTMAVGGNLDTTSGGEVQVSGNLGAVSVTGVVQGKGSEDIAVGGDLGGLTVLGGAGDGAGLQDVGLDVADSIQGLDVRGGIRDSLITAGVLIDGGTPGSGSNGWNIGPDGSTAVFDSEILSGRTIRNITIGGDVVSDLPSQPSGRPTRIVAGEYPPNSFAVGGLIDNFQITGNLIDSVLAASATPYQGYYPEPAGVVPVGYVIGTNPLTTTTTLPNDTGPPFANPGVPTNEVVLPGGSINPSFVPSPLASNTAIGVAAPLPSKSTVLGSVIDTLHVNNADYAGIFASDTRGVIIGRLPPILPSNVTT